MIKYTCADLKKNFNITKNQLFYWIQTYKVLNKPKIGTGRKQRYSILEVATLVVFKALLTLGYTKEMAKSLTDDIMIEIRRM